MQRTRYSVSLMLLITLVCGLPSVGEAQASRESSSSENLATDATRTLKTAATYFRSQVASHGGYVYTYSLDLQRRWGEGEADAQTIFVQPPGTPTVGNAYLTAYVATKDAFYSAAAQETAEALVHGQLVSGGWSQTIHFGPAKRLGNYRTGKPKGEWNTSSLDDAQTQSALQFLMRIDQALQFKHAAIHDATQVGLQALLNAQFPNGAFPQVWRAPVTAQAITPAKFPEHDWKTEKREKNYWDYYTLNDGLAGSVAETFIVAHTIYREERFQKALIKLGDFLILAQMPAPQPAWCQQYNYNLEPMWARKFEPPAIAGSESLDVLRTLVRIAQQTGDKKYLEPIPPALEYLQKSLLSDGKLARFYELRTNRPLYMNTKYELTYDDSDLPKHYSWKGSAKLADIQKAYFAAKIAEPLVPVAAARVKQRTAKQWEPQVREVIAALDAQGRWVTRGDEKKDGEQDYLSSELFAENVEILSVYLSALQTPE
jgi:PelA/Pel-15E family pectate lyase